MAVYNVDENWTPVLVSAMSTCFISHLLVSVLVLVSRELILVLLQLVLTTTLLSCMWRCTTAHHKPQSGWPQTWKTWSTLGFLRTWKTWGILREFCATSGKIFNTQNSLSSIKYLCNRSWAWSEQSLVTRNLITCLLTFCRCCCCWWWWWRWWWCC